jgi:hypothetical protein
MMAHCRRIASRTSGAKKSNHELLAWGDFLGGNRARTNFHTQQKLDHHVPGAPFGVTRGLVRDDGAAEREYQNDRYRGGPYLKASIAHAA